MFQWLQDIFSRISDFFSAVWDFVDLAISKIVDFFQLVGKTINFGYEIVKNLPSFYLVFAVLMISVLIIYLVLGRESGGD